MRMSVATDNQPRAWTTAEAAYIVGEPLDRFKKVVERSPVKAAAGQRGGAWRFALRDLVFLVAYPQLQKDFTTEGRARLYEALLHVGTLPIKVEAGDIVLNLGRHLSVVEAKTRQLDKYASQVDVADGEARIKGTAIEVHRLAALIEGGMSVGEVQRDYPGLTIEQIEAARAWAASHPKPGRPFPRQSAKEAMRGADLSALEDLLGARE
jgi:uncharacterized protein (DUF433 family)